MNCGNQVAENGGKKKSSNQKNCGNGIVEMEGKKKLWQWHCRNRRKKKIVAMELPK